MKSNYLVSIIINNYNYGRFIREAIDSALNQTYSYKEVIVVDDGSTDDSREIIASYGNKIISVLKENGGQASSFNAGFEVSQGDIICFLDSDDVFLPEKLAEIVNVFENYQNIGWCYHSIKLLDVKSNKCFQSSYEYFSSCECDFRLQMKRGTHPFKYPPTSGMCFSRLLISKILPMPEAITITSDNYIKYTAVCVSKGYFLNKKLAIQKIHGANAYTLRNDKQQLKVRIALLTAYWMQVKFPFLSGFTDSLLAHCIASYWSIGGLEPECRDIVNKYLSPTGLLKRLKIYSKALYSYIKNYKTFSNK